jgi:hypothetical protein
LIALHIDGSDPATVVNAIVAMVSDICPRVNMDIADGIMALMTAAVVIDKTYSGDDGGERLHECLAYAVKAADEMFEWERTQ